jgi:integrase
VGHQNAHYLKLKGNTYYFSRRVPKRLQRHCSRDRIEVCLHTSSRHQAARYSIILSSQLEDQWAVLKRRDISQCLWTYFETDQRLSPTNGSMTADNSTTDAPRLSEATQTYVFMKGANRSSTFASGVQRSVRYLVEVASDKPIDAFVRADANALRDYLKARGLSSESIKRNLSNLRAIINFVSKELGLEPTLAFSGVYLGEDVEVPKRMPVAVEDIKRIQRLCRQMDDEPRWAIALLSDTGLRLSEALGLTTDEIHLNATIPYIEIKRQLWRRLKTKSSERKVPLVGEALWALKQASKATDGPMIFPKYCTPTTCKSNSASAALNKWLKSKGTGADQIVLHSFRHSLRDRLRAVECPTDIIDTIGGWSKPGVGEGYGAGYSTDVLHKWMAKIVLKT